MLVMVIRLGSLAAVRVQSRSCQTTRDYAEARTCAVSALELSLMHVEQNPAWRTAWPNGTWMANQPLGGGALTLQGTDPEDGDLADSPYDALILTGIGVKGVTRHKTQVVLVPVIQPLEALNTCLHGSNLIQIKSGKRLTTIGAPVSTNGQFDNDGTVDGNVEAASVNHVGTVTGTLSVSVPSKQLPASSVMSSYAHKATSVPYNATIDKAVLAPGCNPWGATDPNGLYIINTAGGDLVIKNSRIYGTLIVELGSGTLTLDGAILLHNYRSNFPVLIVEGNVVIKCTSADTMLSESTADTNFNPVGAPYEGVWDSDSTDSYPNEIRGLVHIVGSLKLQQTARIVGAVICDGPVYAEENNTIVHSPGLYAIPPDGYTYVDGMKISPDSWKQVID
jgi:hypothetical protein